MRPSTRRVVTEHDAKGNAVIRSDVHIPVKMTQATGYGAALLWTTEEVPADNQYDVQGENRPVGVTLHGGSAFWASDFAPGLESPMHRTYSVDYAIVISGSIQFELDSGEVTDLFPGDVVVQRGTNHIWRNVGTDWCRVMFVMIEAAPVRIDGVLLKETDMSGIRAESAK
jgi:quercetin dioxygenase-like cupin family protein